VRPALLRALPGRRSPVHPPLRGPAPPTSSRRSSRAKARRTPASWPSGVPSRAPCATCSWSRPSPLTLGRAALSGRIVGDWRAALPRILAPYGELVDQYFREEKVKTPLVWMAAQSGPPPSRADDGAVPAVAPALPRGWCGASPRRLRHAHPGARGARAGARRRGPRGAPASTPILVEARSGGRRAGREPALRRHGRRQRRPRPGDLRSARAGGRTGPLRPGVCAPATASARCCG
jgi:hypothetical protein